MAEISEFIKVSTKIATGGVPKQLFGLGLLITVDATRPAGGADKVKKYSNISEVGDDFGSATDPYEAAQAWFSQDPKPQALYITRWSTATVNTELTAGADNASLGNLQDAAGSLRFLGEDFTGIDTSASADLAAVASTVQAALRGSSNSVLNNVDVVYDSGTSRFKIELSGTAPLATPYMEEAASGNDLSGGLGFQQSQNPVYREGSAAEGIGTCIDVTLRHMPEVPYYLFMDNGCPQVYSDDRSAAELSDRAEAGDFMAFIQETAEGAETANEGATDAAIAFSSQYNRTHTSYSTFADDHKHISAAALYSAQNFDQPGSVITGMGKTLPGQKADPLGSTAIAELFRKRVNIYTNVSGLPTYAEGWNAKAGIWTDARIWIDWLGNEIERSIWNLIRSTSRVPATPYGIAQIRETLAKVMEKGVRNGGIGVGLAVSPTMKAEIRQITGNYDFDGTLINGYLIHIGSLADQTQADRDSRLAPPIKIWAKGSNAIHRANIDLVFEN